MEGDKADMAMRIIASMAVGEGMSPVEIMGTLCVAMGKVLANGVKDGSDPQKRLDAAMQLVRDVYEVEAAERLRTRAAQGNA